MHAEKLKDFVLIAYKINPDHVHLLVKCGETYDGTQIVHCIKRISAVQINQIITLGTEEERKDLAVTEVTVVLARAFKLKYGAPSTYPFPLFKWQPGFTDVTIHSRQQLMNTWRYIRDQATHHNLEENTHLLLRTLEPEGLVFPG